MPKVDSYKKTTTISYKYRFKTYPVRILDPRYTKRIIHYYLLMMISVMQGWFRKPISVIPHIKKKKKRNHIISIQEEKAFGIVQDSFLINQKQKRWS
jgi:hypothetical protein